MKYVVGVDYGTLSGRALLVEVKTGREIDSRTFEYPHGVMDSELPSGVKLGHDWALQHPRDYLDVLEETIPPLLKDNSIDKNEIIGIGIDFTACTVLPVMSSGTPLCFLDEFKDRPHAYVKLWKHHSAQTLANRLNDLANSRKEEWIGRYGYKISSEWMGPKIWEIVEEDPEVYRTMDRFIEAADWIVWKLTGKEVRNLGTAGYKAMWNEENGYPTRNFFYELNPLLESFVEEKLSSNIKKHGELAGYINEEAAKFTGLNKGTPVAVANIDAHVTMASAKIYEPGKMLAIIGTSTCHILLDDKFKKVPGICGVVKDGAIPGFYAYEAGQSCVGDSFAWFVENCVPEKYQREAENLGIGVHEYLSNKSEKLKVGESGLIALDWWNGNRTVLVDVDLTGMILGMNLQTKPEEIYRAILESTAFGTRKIIETLEKNGIEVNEFYASGGISQKNDHLMQIYADVLNMPIYIVDTMEGPALGSAIHAAVAAGSARGGYDSVKEASEAMGKVREEYFQPIKENARIYDEIYREYSILHDYFGKTNDIMKRLKTIKERY